MANAHRFYVPVGVLPLPAPPVSPQTGDTYFDTTLGQLQSWDGSGWIGASSDADLDANFVDVVGDSMTGELILPDQVTVPPSAPTVVAAKGYVDQLVTVNSVPPSLPPARDGLVWSVVGWSGPWSPKAIPGLVAWIDPVQDTYADGERVNTYREHANGSEFTVPLGGEGPVFRAGGNPYLDFAVTHAGLTSALQRPWPNGMTLISVNAVTGGSYPMMVVVGPDADGVEMRHSGSTLELVVMYTTYSLVFTHSTPSAHVKALYALRVAPGMTPVAWTNAVREEDTRIMGEMYTTPQTLWIGRREGGYYFYGPMYETLVYDGPVSDADMVLLYDYLAAKHGLVLP